MTHTVLMYWPNTLYQINVDYKLIKNHNRLKKQTIKFDLTLIQIVQYFVLKLGLFGQIVKFDEAEAKNILIIITLLQKEERENRVRSYFFRPNQSSGINPIKQNSS